MLFRLFSLSRKAFFVFNIVAEKLECVGEDGDGQQKDHDRVKLAPRIAEERLLLGPQSSLSNLPKF